MKAVLEIFMNGGIRYTPDTEPVVLEAGKRQTFGAGQSAGSISIRQSWPR